MGATQADLFYIFIRPMNNDSNLPLQSQQLPLSHNKGKCAIFSLVLQFLQYPELLPGVINNHDFAKKELFSHQLTEI